MRTGFFHSFSKYFFIFLANLFFVSSGNIFPSETGRAGAAGSFLRMGLGARAMGMGGGSVSLTNDGYAGYYNCAGLVFIDGRYATVTLNSMALDRRLMYLGYAMSFENKAKGLLKGGFAAGWLSAGVNNIDGRDFNGNDIGTFANQEHCFLFSFALNPVDPVAIGLTAKVVYNAFPDLIDDGESLSAVGMGFDFGIMVRPFSQFIFGLTIKDINTKYTWNTQELYDEGTKTYDSFPTVLRFGVSYHFSLNRLIATFDLEKITDRLWKYIFGMECEAYDGVFLRGGLSKGDLTLGAGFKLPVFGNYFQVDYAFVPDPEASSDIHVFTWSYLF